MVAGVHVLGMWVDRVGPLTIEQIGRLGVLVFFVHTSLVLMASLERLEAAGESGGRLALIFYLRRAFRIYPLSIVCVLAYVVFRVPNPSWPGHLTSFVPPTPRDLLANLALVDVFGVRWINGVLWSLPVELEMYVVLPACYFAAKRGPRYVIGLFVVAVIGWSAVGLFHIRGLRRLSVLNFGPCFVAGVMAYALLRRRYHPRLPGWIWPLAIAACALLPALMRADIEHPERGWLFCVAVGACIPFVRELNRSWLTRVASIVATYSYGIYLTHVAAIWVAFVVLSGLPLAARWLAFIAIASGLPFLAYHAVERPMIALGIRLTERFRKGRAAATDAAAVAPVP
jgi:peptidoglycan/LPS O-acetylase OafA/YrhL